MVPRASIVIPLLNQADAWLDQAIRSALGQTVECDVVVVISPLTCESNRRVLETIRANHPSLRLATMERQRGFAAALNLGIRTAAADRIGFLLSDDWLEVCAVEECLRHEADIVSTSQTFYAADGKQILEEISRVRTTAAYDRLSVVADKAEFLGHFLLFRRSILEAVGGVDETLGDSPGIDDFDLPWCMLERNASVAIVPQALYNYRDHDGERLTTRSLEEMQITFNRILDKHGVFGVERQRLVRHHSRWFGRSMWSVYQDLAPASLPWLLRPLQRLYRMAIPLEIRFAIHDRWIEAVAHGRKPDHPEN
jgi:glycosyltransferase involved in cell wall biosynthesis